MKSIPFYLTLLICLFCSINSQAQKQQSFQSIPLTAGPSGYARCASTEVDFVRRLNNPNIQSMEDFEKWLAPKVAEYKSLQAENKTTGVITIPCVVHVLHNGEAVGSAPNIPDAQVLSQIQVLNEDFRRILGTNGYNNHPDGADVELEFCMASVDPYGQSTNGVNRININQDGATRDDLENTIKPSTIWDPTQYMNMWTVKFAAPDDNLLGYAQFPEGSGLAGVPASGEDPTTDGVVMRFEAFGTKNADDGTFILMNNYDLGRTATHEVGHWVGLRHIWGDGIGCNLPAVPPGCSCLFDDYCDDTPNQEGARYDCDLPYSSVCNVPPVPDMTANYMDYSNDGCMNIFTNDQKARVQAVMANSPRRMELVTSPACAPPSPYISFATANTVVTEGSSCNIQTVEIQLNISQAPREDATVQFSVSGTANEGAGNDFTIGSTNVVFPANSIASQTVTIGLQEDAMVEASEFISLHIDTVVTSGDALRALTNLSHTITILDDDFGPEQAGSSPHTLIFSENFNTLGVNWTIVNGPASAAEWKVGTPPLGVLGNYHAFISLAASPVPLYLYDPNADGYSSLESPAINAANATKLDLTFTYTCFGEEGYDFGTLWYQKNGGPWAQFGSEISAQPVETTITVPLPADAENTAALRLAFRWQNDALIGGHPPFSFDNVELRATAGAPADVQEDVTAESENYLGPYATVHFYDPASGDIMATVTNNSDYDFGCASLEVDRSIQSAGSDAVPFWNNDPANALAAKTFYLQTANNVPPAGVTLTTTLFYTKSELNAWESATQQSKNDLEVVWVNGQSISTITPANGGANDIILAASDINNYTSTNYKVVSTAEVKSGGIGIGVPGAPVASALINPMGNNVSSNNTSFDGKLINTLFPNPVSNQLTVVLNRPEENARILLQNQFGQTVQDICNINADRHLLNTQALPNGIYFLTAIVGENKESEKIIVQRK